MTSQSIFSNPINTLFPLPSSSDSTVVIMRGWVLLLSYQREKEGETARERKYGREGGRGGGGGVPAILVSVRPG